MIAPNCADAFCHGAGNDYVLFDTIDDAYASLVGVPAQGPMCAPTGLVRVVPGHPDRSLLFLKITQPPCGSRMPLNLGPPLPRSQIEQIGQWIACGALDGDRPCPPDAGVFVFDGSVAGFGIPPDAGE